MYKIKNKNMKFFAWFNVIIRLLIVDLLFRILAPLVYVPIYIFRGPIRAFRGLPVIGWVFIPLWIFLDDTGDYGNKMECWDIIGCKPDSMWHKFRCAYYWSAIRNVAWNSYEFGFFKGIDPSKPCTDYDFIYGYQYVYDKSFNKKVWNKFGATFNAALFYNKNNDGSHTQSLYNGEYVDMANSQFGKSKYYFRNNNRWWVFYTHCDITKIKNNTIWLKEFNIGAANNRVLFRYKKQHGLIDNNS